jgi:hypothetical protein
VLFLARITSTLRNLGTLPAGLLVAGKPNNEPKLPNEFVCFNYQLLYFHHFLEACSLLDATNDS